MSGGGNDVWLRAHAALYIAHAGHGTCKPRLHVARRLRWGEARGSGGNTWHMEETRVARRRCTVEKYRNGSAPFVAGGGGTRHVVAAAFF